MDSNTFNNGINKQEYLFKLIPDLSVFDIAEKWFVDNGQRGVQKLFFYNPKNDEDNEDIDLIKFRRFIVKSNSQISLLSVNANPDIITHRFEIDGEYYLIVIDEQLKSGG